VIWPARFDVLQPDTLIVALFATSSVRRETARQGMRGTGEGKVKVKKGGYLGKGREGKGGKQRLGCVSDGRED
jgi:hypothetical protein